MLCWQWMLMIRTSHSFKILLFLLRLLKCKVFQIFIKVHVYPHTHFYQICKFYQVQEIYFIKDVLFVWAHFRNKRLQILYKLYFFPLPSSLFLKSNHYLEIDYDRYLCISSAYLRIHYHFVLNTLNFIWKASGSSHHFEIFHHLVWYLRIYCLI